MGSIVCNAKVPVDRMAQERTRRMKTGATTTHTLRALCPCVCLTQVRVPVVNK